MTDIKQQKIVVWCHYQSQAIKPCVNKWLQEPPCGLDKCSAICNYLNDYAKTNEYEELKWQ
jgi:hypothetical protein